MQCVLCANTTPAAESLVQEAEQIVDHIRVMHPEQYGDGPERWPDGSLVLEDDTLEPSDFRET